MATSLSIDTAHRSVDDEATRRRITAGVWLLPAAGALTLWATLTHQPDPTIDFASWARFVTTGEFLVKHLLGSIAGLALNTVGAAALAWTVLTTSRRSRDAVWGFILMVFGSAGLTAGFGVAAFAQPAIGNLELEHVPGAQAVYDDVYGLPTFVTLIGGGLLFAAATVVLARAAWAIDGVALWARLSYGASGPLIAVLGVAIGPLQTLGSAAAIAGGAGIALAAGRRNAAAEPTS